MKEQNGRNAYIYGSAAPQRYEEAPERVPRRLSEEEIRKRQVRHYAQENQRKAARFGGLYTLFLTAAVAVTLMICIRYIATINEHTAYTKQIESLRTEVEELKESNDLSRLAIETSIDYNYIYKVATEELGMVYPGIGQIVTYSSGESEYVIQYSDFSSH